MIAASPSKPPYRRAWRLTLLVVIALLAGWVVRERAIEARLLRADPDSIPADPSLNRAPASGRVLVSRDTFVLLERA